MIYSDFMELQKRDATLCEEMGFKELKREDLTRKEKALVTLIKKDSFYKNLNFKIAYISQKGKMYKVLVDNQNNYYEI